MNIRYKMELQDTRLEIKKREKQIKSYVDRHMYSAAKKEISSLVIYLDGKNVKHS